MAKVTHSLHKKMKFSIKDISSKCDQIRRKLQIWSHLLKKSLMENYIFCAVTLWSTLSKNEIKKDEVENCHKELIGKGQLQAIPGFFKTEQKHTKKHK